MRGTQPRAQKTPSKRASGADTKRVRRSPEEARAHILDAAERVFAKHLPDVVGLKEIAREAGVSHALVTHYFGTYDALVEATLEGRFHKIREKLVPVVTALVMGEADSRAILGAHRRALVEAASDPATVKLAAWAMLSGRVGATDFFPHRMQGLKMLANAFEARSKAPREDLEYLLFASFALTIVWTLGKTAFAGALGRTPTRELDEDFSGRIDAMLHGYLERAERHGRS
jgi:AcrR family transcriptional regulator